MTPSRLPRTTNAARLVVFIAFLAPSLLAFPPSARALIATNENAKDELGQFTSTTVDTTPNWTQGAINNNAAGINALGLDNPGNTALDPVNHNLYVVDSSNNRVLVYTLNTDNSISTASGGHTATYVLGQANLTSGAANRGGTTGAATLSTPLDVAFDAANTRLFVADFGNNRVLVFDLASGVTTGMNASYELGQPSGVNAFTTTGGSVTQSGMSGPAGLAYDAANTRLFVADYTYNRVTVFNVAPSGGSMIANGENANTTSGLLGQTTFTSGSGSGHGAATMNNPDALAYDPVNLRLFVADETNNRVTVFKVPTNFTNDESASYALGAANLTTVGAGTCTQTTMNNPGGVAYDPAQGTLFVGDYNLNRVTAWNAAPGQIATGEKASYVLGSTSFTSCNCDNPAGSTTQQNLCFANFLMYDPGSSRLFVDDASNGPNGNNRIMIFDGGTLPNWTPGYD